MGGCIRYYQIFCLKSRSLMGGDASGREEAIRTLLLHLRFLFQIQALWGFLQQEGWCRRQQPLYCGQNQPSCGALCKAARLTLLCWTSAVSTYIVVKTNQMVEHTTLRRTTLWLISTRPPFPRMYTLCSWATYQTRQARQKCSFINQPLCYRFCPDSKGETELIANGRRPLQFISSFSAALKTSLGQLTFVLSCMTFLFLVVCWWLRSWRCDQRLWVLKTFCISIL